MIPSNNIYLNLKIQMAFEKEAAEDFDHQKIGSKEFYEAFNRWQVADHRLTAARAALLPLSHNPSSLNLLNLVSFLGIGTETCSTFIDHAFSTGIDYGSLRDVQSIERAALASFFGNQALSDLTETFDQDSNSNSNYVPYQELQNTNESIPELNLAGEYSLPTMADPSVDALNIEGGTQVLNPEASYASVVSGDYWGDSNNGSEEVHSNLTQLSSTSAASDSSSRNYDDLPQYSTDSLNNGIMNNPSDSFSTPSQDEFQSTQNDNSLASPYTGDSQQADGNSSFNQQGLPQSTRNSTDNQPATQLSSSYNDDNTHLASPYIEDKLTMNSGMNAGSIFDPNQLDWNKAHPLTVANARVNLIVMQIRNPKRIGMITKIHARGISVSWFNGETYGYNIANARFRNDFLFLNPNQL